VPRRENIKPTLKIESLEQPSTKTNDFSLGVKPNTNSVTLNIKSEKPEVI